MRAIIVIGIFLLLGFVSCKKDCESNPETGCKDVVPNELCMAYFERWFFNQNNNSCEKIGYSGCSQKGFATEQECEECKCI